MLVALLALTLAADSSRAFGATDTPALKCESTYGGTAKFLCDCQLETDTDVNGNAVYKTLGTIELTTTQDRAYFLGIQTCQAKYKNLDVIAYCNYEK
jgi:hypothetical protein